MFFDVRRYDLARVGRYKYNKKLHFRNRLNGHILADDVVDVSTGEIIAEAGTTCNRAIEQRFRTQVFRTYMLMQKDAV